MNVIRKDQLRHLNVISLRHYFVLLLVNVIRKGAVTSLVKRKRAVTPLARQIEKKRYCLFVPAANTCDSDTPCVCVCVFAHTLVTKVRPHFMYTCVHFFFMSVIGFENVYFLSHFAH